MYNQSTSLTDLGFIIHLRPYQETSAILEIFTAKHGRISCIRRGLRGRSNRRQFMPQAFIELEIQLKNKRNKLMVDRINPTSGHSQLSLHHYRIGLYLNELIYRLTQPEDPHFELYQSYQETLKALNHSRPEIVLRPFELKLFSNIGYEIPFHLLTNAPFHAYDIQQGFSAFDEYHSNTFSTQSLLDLSQHQYQNHPREQKQFIRSIISQLLDGMTLNSYQLFR